MKIQFSNKQIIIKSFWHENCYFFEKSKCYFSFGKIRIKKLTEHDNVLAENHFYRSSNYQFNCVTLHLTFYVHYLSSTVLEIQLNHDYPKKCHYAMTEKPWNIWWQEKNIKRSKNAENVSNWLFHVVRNHFETSPDVASFLWSINCTSGHFIMIYNW